jgi:hypothetical protein
MSELYPPHRHVSAFHIIGQESKIKGIRLAEVYWNTTTYKWFFPKQETYNGVFKIRDDLKNCWKYTPKELFENSWIYIEAGRL